MTNQPKKDNQQSKQVLPNQDSKSSLKESQQALPRWDSQTKLPVAQNQVSDTQKDPKSLSKSPSAQKIEMQQSQPRQSTQIITQQKEPQTVQKIEPQQQSQQKLPTNPVLESSRNPQSVSILDSNSQKQLPVTKDQDKEPHLAQETLSLAILPANQVVSQKDLQSQPHSQTKIPQNQQELSPQRDSVVKIDPKQSQTLIPSDKGIQSQRQSVAILNKAPSVSIMVSQPPFDDDNDSELEFLQHLQSQIEDTQNRADMMYDAFPDEVVQSASNTVKNLDQVLQTFQQESSTQQEDISFAVDNAILEYAIKSRKMQDHNEEVSVAMMDRNNQVGRLITKSKVMQQQMSQQEDYIYKLEQQLSVQSKNVRNLQNKYDDEHRVRMVQETLRQPKEKISFAQKQYQNLVGLPEAPNLQENKFQDGNIKSDPYDFWQSDKQNGYQYPGQPKRLHDVVNPNQMWIGKEQKQNDGDTKFKYQQRNEININDNNDNNKIW